MESTEGMRAELARMFGKGPTVSLGPRRIGTSKVYENVVPGSRAEGREPGERGWRVRWIAGDVPERGLFRKRRAALAECRAGNDDAQPRLVLVSPGPFRQVFPVGTPRALAAAAVEAYDAAHTFELAGGA